MANAEHTPDIPFDKLKSLFQELRRECEKLPSNKVETWQECEQEARAELSKKARAEARKRRAEEKKQAKIAEDEAVKKADEAKKKAAAAAMMSGTSLSGPHGGPAPKPPDTTLDAKPKKAKIPELSPLDIYAKTLAKYTGANHKYLDKNRGCWNKINMLLRQIHHALLPTYKKQLLTYDQAKDTLLAGDWRKIRDHFANAVICDFSPDSLRACIDTLEIIRADLGLQKEPQPRSPVEPPAETPTPEPPGNTGQGKRTSTGDKARDTQRTDGLTGEALALAMLVEHPEWSDTKIAEAVGVNRTTLYDWPDFKKAKEALKQGKKESPRGSKKSETGDMEAWEADTSADT